MKKDANLELVLSSLTDEGFNYRTEENRNLGMLAYLNFLNQGTKELEILAKAYKAATNDMHADYFFDAMVKLRGNR